MKRVYWMLMIIGGILIIGGFIMYAFLKPESKFNLEKSFQSILNPTLSLGTIIGQQGFSQYKRNPEIDYFKVSKDNGLKISYRGYAITYQPLFVLQDDSILTWNEIPENIEKDLWKTQVKGNKYKYGATFSGLTTAQKNALKYVVLHRTSATKEVWNNITNTTDIVPMTLSDIQGKIKKQGNTIILNNKVYISHDDILSTYNIPVINISDIVIGGLDNSWVVCDNEICSENHTEYNWISNGDGTWNISFDPTITLDEEEVVSTSLLTNVTAETGNANFTHLNISTTTPYDNLVFYMSFDGDKENTKLTTSYDFSQYNNDGVGIDNAYINSTGCLPGFDGCLHLDGIDDGSSGDAVVISDPPSLRNHINQTIMYWEKPGSYTQNSDQSQIVSKEPLRWFVGHHTDGDLYVRLGNVACNGNLESFDYSDTAPTIGVWTHIAWRINDTAGTTIEVWKNGVSLGTLNSANPRCNSSTTDLHIGRRRVEDEYFNGSIDEVMIFNTSLTAQQILDIYNNQSARFSQTGTQKVRAVNITNTTTWDDNGDNRVNLTTSFDNNLESNVSARIGQINSSVNVSDLVLYMPFEWGSAVDISEEGNDGIFVDNAFINQTGGVNGTSGLELDGVDDGASGDMVTISDSDDFDMINRTISYWEKPTTYNHNSDEAEVIGRSYYNWYVGHGTNGDLYFLIGGDTCGAADDLVTSFGGTAPTLNVWTHIVWTFSLVTDDTTIEVWKNGVSQGTQENTDNGLCVDGGEDLFIGARHAGSENFNGSIDEVMIFNRSLSDAEISELYNKTSEKFNIAYYTPYQNLTSGANSTFTIDTEADFIFPDLQLIAGPNQTSTFYTPIVYDDIIMNTYTEEEAPVDIEYPVFSNYWDDNASLEDTGIGNFNVTLLSTNGTVLLEIDGNNITAGNLSANEYNATYTFSSGGVYSYVWHSWGNGTLENFNTSVTQSYTVNVSNSCTCAGVDTNWEINMSDYCNITTDCDLGTGTLNWTGTGWANCSANINTTDMTKPDVNQILYISKDCLINIFSLFWSLIK